MTTKATKVQLDYTYPEEDFCLFKDFPHTQLVFPIIDSLHIHVCTCTLSWIVKYADMYQKYDTERFEYIHDYYSINSTLFYIYFSVSRFLLSTSQSSSRVFKSFQKLKLKLFYSLVAILSGCLSLFKVFQFKVNSFLSIQITDFPYDEYGISFCTMHNELDFFKYKLSQDKCSLFAIFNMINIILNNILFFFVSIIIDIGLIRFAKQNLKIKLNLLRYFVISE